MSLIILFVIISISCFELFFIYNQKEQLSEILTTAYDSAKSGDIKTAQKKTLEFQKALEKKEKGLLMFVHNGEIDEIYFSTKRIVENISSGDINDFYADSKRVLALLDHIYEVEVPKIYYIF